MRLASAPRRHPRRRRKRRRLNTATLEFYPTVIKRQEDASRSTSLRASASLLDRPYAGAGAAASSGKIMESLLSKPPASARRCFSPHGRSASGHPYRSIRVGAGTYSLPTLAGGIFSHPAARAIAPRPGVFPLIRSDPRQPTGGERCAKARGFCGLIESADNPRDRAPARGRNGVWRWAEKNCRSSAQSGEKSSATPLMQ